MIFHEYLSKFEIPFCLNAETKTLSTIKAGGCVSYLISPRTEDELLRAIRLCESFCIPYLLLGGFSNTAISEGGFFGAVIYTRGLCGVDFKGTAVEVGCGVMYPCLTKSLAESDLFVSAELSGIPASIGGMVRNNAGAYGEEISNFLISARLYDIKTSKIVKLGASELGFSYRSSILTERRFCLLSATLSVNVKEKREILKDIRAFAEKRRQSQPSAPSLGCFFKSSGGVSAGALIDSLGLKGFTVGGAEISDKHAGFIINRGGATVEDIDSLAKIAEAAVYGAFGIRLRREAELIL